MSKFKRDELRVVVVFGCLGGLLVQLVAETFLGLTIGQGLTNSFVTLIVAAIADSAWEKFSEKRGPSDDPPSRPPSKELPSSRPPNNERRHERSDIESLAIAV